MGEPPRFSGRSLRHRPPPSHPTLSETGEETLKPRPSVLDVLRGPNQDLSGFWPLLRRTKRDLTPAPRVCSERVWNDTRCVTRASETLRGSLVHGSGGVRSSTPLTPSLFPSPNGSGVSVPPRVKFRSRTLGSPRWRRGLQPHPRRPLGLTPRLPPCHSQGGDEERHRHGSRGTVGECLTSGLLPRALTRVRWDTHLQRPDFYWRRTGRSRSRRA